MSYLGSKAVSGAFQAIIAEMPPHDVYIESHLGSGVVMARKPPAARSIGIDRDEAALARAEIPGDVERVCADAVEFLDGFDYAGSRVLVYADPPYLLSTRTSRHRYRFEYDEADHVRLLECLQRIPAAVIVSGYPSALYDELLSGWRTKQFQAMTRGGVRTEQMWMNFEAGAHWHTFAGRNFTDRQRIKRKAERWASNYRALPAGERLAVLAALLAVEGGDRL